MPVRRSVFNILTDTGAGYTDTGAPVNGLVLGAYLKLNDTGQLDTGANVTITAVGSERQLAKWDNVGAASRAINSRQAVHDTGGAVIDGQYEYFMLADESLRVNVEQGGVAKSATLYVWHGW
jgi:hypothetical protein